MKRTKGDAVSKIIFWQQLAGLIFALLLSIFWWIIINDMIVSLKSGYFSKYYIPYVCSTVFCSLSTYAAYLLYQSLNFLKAYQNKEEKLDLELAFRKQRHFWRSGPLIFLLLIITAIGLFFLFYLTR
jgi:hypothetical protein